MVVEGGEEGTRRRRDMDNKNFSKVTTDVLEAREIKWGRRGRIVQESEE